MYVNAWSLDESIFIRFQIRVWLYYLILFVRLLMFSINQLEFNLMYLRIRSDAISMENLWLLKKLQIFEKSFCKFENSPRINCKYIRNRFCRNIRKSYTIICYSFRKKKWSTPKLIWGANFWFKGSIICEGGLVILTDP